MSRKLASLRIINDIVAIPDADKIHLLIIGGWQAVASKEEGHKVGDLIAYLEIDSFLDTSDPRFAFLEPRAINWNNLRGARIKTIRLRGTLSQGLVLPLKHFPELMALDHFFCYKQALNEDYVDVTELLGIKQWERIEKQPGFNAGNSRGNFPSFIQKTDQSRLQGIVATVNRNSHAVYEKSVKLDGSSMTTYVVQKSSPYFALANKEGLEIDQVHGVASRNIDLKSDDANSLFWQIARSSGAVDALIAQDKSIAIQGELIAPSIQKNFEQVSEPKYVIFSVFDIDKQEYLLPMEARRLVEGMGLEYVPILGYVRLQDEFDSVADYLTAAEGPGAFGGPFREGLVYKRLDKHFTFKTVSNSYLEKTGN